VDVDADREVETEECFGEEADEPFETEDDRLSEEADDRERDESWVRELERLAVGLASVDWSLSTTGTDGLTERSID
jgi:hypothetical protein